MSSSSQRKHACAPWQAPQLAVDQPTSPTSAYSIAGPHTWPPKGRALRSSPAQPSYPRSWPRWARALPPWPHGSPGGRPCSCDTWPCRRGSKGTSDTSQAVSGETSKPVPGETSKA
eukprot:4506340-Alexandrium_andersonii.AAC.1